MTLDLPSGIANQKLGASQIDSVLDHFSASAKSHLGFTPRIEQLGAARQLLGRVVAEMGTGEGKTLTLAAAASLFASASLLANDNLLASKNLMSRDNRCVYVATANDYLAQRDAQWMRPIYRDLGFTVSHVTSQSQPEERIAAYQSNVVYATIREFGFDFLRAALAKRSGQSNVAQVTCDALIVDEADSVLIDEARTPLIITAPVSQTLPAMEACYQWAARVAKQFNLATDFVRTDASAVALTESGSQRVFHLPMPNEMGPLGMTDIIHSLECAIWINQTMRTNRDYIVRDGRVSIVNEYTGRASDNRLFATGIQQAIEARERLSISPPSQPVARISIQDFVDKFDHVCGITATATEDRKEFKQVYDLKVISVPPHNPSQRQMLETHFCRDQESKWQAIVNETKAMIAIDRAVLIGTRNIPQSISLAKALAREDVDHAVLNALNHAHEAAIIAGAGQCGQVTVATNMAGRGTDIKLSAEVLAAGGLHVIVSEPHEESRIDRQLIGRCARQGNPGSARIYLSRDDQILSQTIRDKSAKPVAKPVAKLVKQIAHAQYDLSRQRRLQRSRLMAHETAMAMALQKLGLDPHLDPLHQ